VDILERLRVLIAEKDIMYRKILADAVGLTDYGQVTHISSSGQIALDWLSQSEIDVVLLDVCIIKTDGINVLNEMLTSYGNTAVVITGTNSPEDAVVVLEALKLGALDVLLKTSYSDRETSLNGIRGYLHTLFAQIKVKNYSSPADENMQIKQLDTLKPAEKERTFIQGEKRAPLGTDLLVIASSTGGPQALQRILSEISPDFNKPVLVVQHMPLDFTRVLAQSLDKKCKLPVREAGDGEMVEAGKVLIAPGDSHMVLERKNDSDVLIRLEKSPPVNGLRPSADKLFDSVTKTYKKSKILVVVLTGMGNDGTKGIVEIRNQCECYCITQSENSCIVYGMPKSVYDAGLSDEVSDIGDIAKRINQINMCGGSGE